MDNVGPAALGGAGVRSTPVVMILDFHKPIGCWLAIGLLCALAPLPSPAQDNLGKREVQGSPGTANIRAVQEDGRTIFVNDADPAPARVRRASANATLTRTGNSATQAQPPQQVKAYVYWSNTEHRWKPVPGPSPKVLRRAETAVAEVQQRVESRPAAVASAGQTRPPEIANPNYTRLAEGRAITSKEIDRIIEDSAAKHRVDPNLVRALVRVESNFNPSAVSRKGAMGLMQLMPATARQLNVSNPFSPQQNVDAGVQLLRRLLDNYGGNVPLALAAYNAGEGAVSRYRGVPRYAETQDYVRRISLLYNGQPNLLFYTAPIRVSRNEFGVLTFSNVE